MHRFQSIVVCFCGALISSGAAASYPNFTFKSQFEINSAINYNATAENNFNIGNRVLEIPQENFVLLPRGELKVVYQRKVRAIIRPSYRILGERVEHKNPDDGRQGVYGKADLRDAFIDFSLPQHFVLSLGKQSYQWGPAETLSPSNPLFHFEKGAKSFLFQQVGRGLAKLNGSLSATSNITLLVEVFDTLEPNWIAEQTFSSKFLARYEKQQVDSLNYLGLSAGQIDKQRLFIGEYWNWSFADGWSFYGDARHTDGANNYEPVLVVPGFYDMQLAADAKGRYFSLATLGLRWEGDWDIRLEWIYNEAGYNSDEMKNALSAGSTLTPRYIQNLRRLSGSGLEFWGKNYGYLSLRKTKIFSFADTTLFLRYFRSIQDESSSTQLSLEKGLSDSTMGYLETSFTGGGNLQEFTLADHFQILLGTRWTL